MSKQSPPISLPTNVYRIRDKYRVQFYRDDRTIVVGVFDTADEAILARNKWLMHEKSGHLKPLPPRRKRA